MPVFTREEEAVTVVLVLAGVDWLRQLPRHYLVISRLQPTQWGSQRSFVGFVRKIRSELFLKWREQLRSQHSVSNGFTYLDQLGPSLSLSSSLSSPTNGSVWGELSVEMQPDPANIPR